MIIVSVEGQGGTNLRKGRTIDSRSSLTCKKIIEFLLRARNNGRDFKLLLITT